MKKVSRIKEPSRAMLIIDVNAAPHYNHLIPQWKTYVGEVISRRHLGGANILFVDGHTEWRKYEQVPDTYDTMFWIAYEK